MPARGSAARRWVGCGGHAHSRLGQDRCLALPSLAGGGRRSVARDERVALRRWRCRIWASTFSTAHPAPGAEPVCPAGHAAPLVPRAPRHCPASPAPAILVTTAGHRECRSWVRGPGPCGDRTPGGTRLGVDDRHASASRGLARRCAAVPWHGSGARTAMDSGPEEWLCELAQASASHRGAHPPAGLVVGLWRAVAGSAAHGYRVVERGGE